MGLHAIHDDDVIGLGGVPIEVDGHAEIRCADLYDVHGRPDRTAHGLLVDAVSVQDGGLAFGGASAVAAHGGHDVRLGSKVFDGIYGGLDDSIDIGDPTASRGDRHGMAGLDLAAGIELVDFGANGTIDFVTARGIEDLSQSEHFWIVHAASGLVSRVLRMTVRRERRRPAGWSSSG